jgi:hypothetical protein
MRKKDPIFIEFCPDTGGRWPSLSLSIPTTDAAARLENGWKKPALNNPGKSCCWTATSTSKAYRSQKAIIWVIWCVNMRLTLLSSTKHTQPQILIFWTKANYPDSNWSALSTVTFMAKDQPKLNWQTLAKRSMNFSV